MSELRRALEKLKSRNDEDNGINIVFTGEKRANNAPTIIREEVPIEKIKALKPIRGVDYYTPQDIKAVVEEVQSKVKDGKDGKNGRDGIGRDGKDGKDAEPLDPKVVAIDAINFLEHFEGDARLSAKALRDLDEVVNEILNNKEEVALTEFQISTIKDLLPKYPPQNAGGSGATFLKSLRDVDISALTKNVEGKYVLGSGGDATSTFETVSKNLDATDATLNYTGDNLTSIVYGSGVTKTFNYTGDNLTSVVLSGTTPSGIDLTKTLSYTGTNLTGVAYS